MHSKLTNEARIAFVAAYSYRAFRNKEFESVHWALVFAIGCSSTATMLAARSFFALSVAVSLLLVHNAVAQNVGSSASDASTVSGGE